jgi:hypothetical protein
VRPFVTFVSNTGLKEMTSRTLAISCVALAITGTAAPAPAVTLSDRENEAAGRALGVAEVAEATLSPAVSPVERCSILVEGAC